MDAKPSAPTAPQAPPPADLTRAKQLYRGYLVGYAIALQGGTVEPKDQGLDACATVALAVSDAKKGDLPRSCSRLLASVALLLTSEDIEGTAPAPAAVTPAAPEHNHDGQAFLPDECPACAARAKGGAS